jgi:hypothetical protein
MLYSFFKKKSHVKPSLSRIINSHFSRLSDNDGVSSSEIAKDLYQGRINSEYLPFYFNRIWPKWVKQQYSHKSPLFIPPRSEFDYLNVTDRTSTKLSIPGEDSLCTMDTSGLINLSDNQWSIDYWVAHKSELISPSMIPNIHQSFSTEFPCITTEFNVDDITIKNESILSSLPKSDNLLISKFTLHNTAPYPISFSFFIAIRPYNLEGISPLNSLSYLSEQAFIVNDNLGILLDKKPDNIVCLNFEDGDVCEYYNKWEMILQSTCNRGLATGFAEYRVTLQENETTSFQITCPVKEYTYKNSPKNLGKTKQKRLKNYIDNIKRIHFDNESTNLFGQWTKYKKNLLEFNFPESSLTSFIKQASIHLLSATKKSFPYKNQENIYLYLTALHSIGKSDIAHKLIQSIYPKKLSLFYLRKHSLENCGYLIDILMNDIYYNFNERKLLMHQPKTTSLANYVISDKAKKRSFMDFANTLHIISSAIYVLQDTQNESEVKKMTIAYKKYSSELETYLNNFEEKIAFQPILPISNTEFHDTRLINGLRSIYPQEVLSRNNFRISHTLQYINDHFLYENSIVSIEKQSGIDIKKTINFAHALIKRRDQKGWEIIKELFSFTTNTGSVGAYLHPQTKKPIFGEGHSIESTAAYIGLIRHSLIEETFTELYIAPLLNKHWLNSEEIIECKNIQTKFGVIEYMKIQFIKNEILFSFDWNLHKTPKLFVCSPVTINSISCDGETREIKSQTIDITPTTKNLSLHYKEQ